MKHRLLAIAITVGILLGLYVIGTVIAVLCWWISEHLVLLPIVILIGVVWFIYRQVLREITP
jgi:hypothetical protein